MPEQDPAPGEATVPVLEDRLHVGRQVVEAGAVRLRKEVDVQPAQVREQVATDVLDVQRVPVGRVVDAAPAVRHDGDVMVVPVVQERLVVRKVLVLVEELRVTRRVEQSTATAEVPLRREHVRVERFDPGTGQWLPDEGQPPASPATNPQE
jgi:uncharacterized protein (TIGR02271 family)